MGSLVGSPVLRRVPVVVPYGKGLRSSCLDGLQDHSRKDDHLD